MPRAEATSANRGRHVYIVKKRLYKACIAVFIIISILYTWLAWEPWSLWQHETTLVTINEDWALNFVDKDVSKKNIFEFHWCRMQRARLDWKGIVAPCSGNTHWGMVPPHWKDQPVTDPITSFLFKWDINPAGEFSRFFIQSQTAEGKPKLIGGDAWRVHLIGPAYIAPIVIDHRNGSYEVLFLPMEHGLYRAEIMLDYSLCNGLRDPPVDWFIKGNAQGKSQRYPEVNKNRDYLLARLWGNNTPVDVNIPLPEEDANSMSKQSILASEAKCNIGGCNLLWDGFGRWTGNKWQPYITNVPPFRSPRVRQGTFCFYGDSVSDFFAVSLKYRKMCRGVFKHCIGEYNWVYPVLNYTIDRRKTDDLDFDVERILNSVREVLRNNTVMNQKSVFLINCGLHYVESVNFTSYQQLINGLIKVFRETYLDSSTNRIRPFFEGRIIWKTTTAINKQRATNVQLGHRRFLTFQRVLLYNAYASWAMCKSGIYILDLYPISDSYPWGTGTHGSRIPAPNDVVHYSNLAFKPAEDLLESIYEP